MDANNITDALGIGAITISYLKDNGCPYEATWFAMGHRFPRDRMDDEAALREIIVRWLWAKGMHTAATKIAKKFSLEQIISNTHQDANNNNANNIEDSLGVGAIVISYLKDNGCPLEARVATTYGFPSTRMADKALREIIIRWFWTKGTKCMQAVAAGFAKKNHLGQVILNILQEEFGGRGGRNED